MTIKIFSDEVLGRLQKFKEFNLHKLVRWQPGLSIYIIAIIITIYGLMRFATIPGAILDICGAHYFNSHVYVGNSPKDIENLVHPDRTGVGRHKRVLSEQNSKVLHSLITAW